MSGYWLRCACGVLVVINSLHAIHWCRANGAEVNTVRLCFESSRQMDRFAQGSDCFPEVSYVTSIRFASRDAVLLFGGKRVWCWHRTTNVCKRLGTINGCIDDIAVHPTSAICAVGWQSYGCKFLDHEAALQVLRYDTGEQLVWEPLQYGNWCSVAFSNDGSVLFNGIGCISDDVGSRDPSGYQLWKGPTLERQPRRERDKGRWSALSPDGKRIVINTGPTGGKIGEVNGGFGIIDTASGDLVWTSDIHEDGAMGFVFSPDGRWFVASEAPWFAAAGKPYQCHPSLVLWDFATLKRHVRLDVRYGDRSTVGFSCDGELVAAVHKESTVKLWSTKTGRELYSMRMSAPVHSLTFGTCHDLLALGHEDGHVSVWQIQRREN